MILQQEREEIVEFGMRLLTSGLTTSTGGNLSIINRAENLVALKPSGVPYPDMRVEDVVVMTPDGQIVDGDKKPSSEINFHLALLRTKTHINAVVHTHQVYATAISCLGWELPAIHYLVGVSGNKVPIADYVTWGTPELAENILRAIGDYQACLLANHGLVTIGETMADAFNVADVIELMAHLYMLTRSAGTPVILSDEEMRRVVQKLGHYGQK
jgi:L-fuculose-phosphate aldolase